MSYPILLDSLSDEAHEGIDENAADENGVYNLKANIARFWGGVHGGSGPDLAITVEDEEADEA